jgi:hypothetical protein
MAYKGKTGKRKTAKAQSPKKKARQLSSPRLNLEDNSW